MVLGDNFVSNTAPKDLGIESKPRMKIFAPGTLDKAEVTLGTLNSEGQDEHTRFGVSCSLWKGSSGGPCVLLDGAGSGGIIGLGTRPLISSQ